MRDSDGVYCVDGRGRVDTFSRIAGRVVLRVFRVEKGECLVAVFRRMVFIAVSTNMAGSARLV